MRAHRLAPLLVAFAVGACASAGASGTRTHGNRNLITHEEIAAAHLSSAQDLVEHLRPSWMRSRNEISTMGDGSADPVAIRPAVFLDGQHFGEFEALRRVDAATVEEIHYLSGAEATMRYGAGYPAGVIEVVTVH